MQIYFNYTENIQIKNLCASLCGWQEIYPH